MAITYSNVNAQASQWTDNFSSFPSNPYWSLALEGNNSIQNTITQYISPPSGVKITVTSNGIYMAKHEMNQVYNVMGISCKVLFQSITGSPNSTLPLFGFYASEDEKVTSIVACIWTTDPNHSYWAIVIGDLNGYTTYYNSTPINLNTWYTVKIIYKVENYIELWVKGDRIIQQPWNSSQKQLPPAPKNIGGLMLGFDHPADGRGVFFLDDLSASGFEPIPTPDFKLSINPPFDTVIRGGSIARNITVASIGGFNQTVALSADGLPEGTAVSLTPSSGSPPFISLMTISTSPTTPSGTYLIRINAVGEILTRNVTYTITVSSAVSSDWPMFRHDPRRTGFTPYETLNAPDLIWNYSTGGAIYSSPAIANGKVYIGSYDHNLYCLNATTGALIWKYTTKSYIESSPAVVNEVYLGSSDNNLYCLNPSTGALIWNYTADGNLYSSPAVVGGKVYILSVNYGTYATKSHLYCLNAINGTPIWERTYDINATISSSPAVNYGKVYIGLPIGIIFSYDASTGRQIWGYNTTGALCSSPSVALGNIYVGDASGIIYCVDAFTGAQKWTYSTGAAIYSSPAIANGKVYIGSYDHNLYCLNATTGALIWKYTTRDIIWSSPAVAANNVYAGSYDCNLYCLDASTGALIWNYTTRDAIYSSPAIADGKVYIGSNDGNIYAFGDIGKEIPYGVTISSEWISKPLVKEKSTGIVKVELTNIGNTNLRIRDLAVQFNFTEKKIAANLIIEDNRKAVFDISVDFPALDARKYTYTVNINFDILDPLSSMWIPQKIIVYSDALDVSAPFLSDLLISILFWLVIPAALLVISIFIYILSRRAKAAKKKM